MEAMGFSLFAIVAALFLGVFVSPVLMAFFYYHGLRDEKQKQGILSRQQKWRIAKQAFFTVSLIVVVFLFVLLAFTYFGIEPELY